MRDNLTRSLPDAVRERLGDSDQLAAAGLAARTSLGIVEARARLLEVRQVGDDVFSLHGYAAVWEQGYDIAGGPDAGGFVETIAAGAVSKSLREQDDVRFLINHEGIALARTRSGTLLLEADDQGLYVHVPALDLSNPKAQELRSALQRGDVDQMSWAFYVTRQQWNSDYTQRRIIETRMVDVSAVTFPANPVTVIGIRSDADNADTAASRKGMPLSLAVAQAQAID